MLIKNAFDILSRASLKIAELGVDSTRFEGTPKQNRIVNQLNDCTRLYDIIMAHILLNDAGSAISGTIGQIEPELNILLLRLKKAASLTSFPQVPTPIHTYVTSSSGSGSGLPLPASEGDILYFHNGAWTILPKGADGTSLTSTSSTIQWTAQVGNGLPSGGSTGQYLRKNSNTSYDVVWDTLSVSKITDLTASAAEINKLDGAIWSTAESNTLAGIHTGSTIQAQLNNKMSSSLAQGSFFVGDGSGLAVARAPLGDVTFSDTGVFAISAGVIVDADVSVTAGIQRTKLANGNTNRIVINSSLGIMTDAAAITASRALISNANGIPVASSTTDVEIGYVSGVTSSLQTQLNDKLSFSSAITPVAGDTLYYSGSAWVNLGIGTVDQVLKSNGTIPVWGSATANGLPAGGTAQQYLRKINSTPYNTEWHTLILADVTDVSATAAEVSLLSGLTATSTVLNYSIGLTGTIQTQLDGKLGISLNNHAIWIGGGGNTALQVGPGVEGSVLTVVAGHPTWQTPPAPGNVSGPVSSTDNAIVRWNGTAGDSIQDSLAFIDDSGNLDIMSQGLLKLHETGSTNYVAIQAAGVMSANYTITLPAAAPGANTYLSYDGSNYVWATVSGGGVSTATASTAGGTITLNFASTNDRIFVGSASFGTAKIVALSNATNALRLEFVFTISALTAVLTFPSNFVMNDGRWDTGTQAWTPLSTGTYKAYAIFDGSNWIMDISQDTYL